MQQLQTKARRFVSPPDRVVSSGDYATRRLKLDTLIQLRWLAVAGQAVAVFVVGVLLKFELPMAACFSVIVLSAALNVYLRMRYPASLRLRGGWAILLLAYDILQLGVLLFLTGGLENPFCFLILVPVIVSATTFDPRHTVVLGLLAIVVTAGLGFLPHFPLPWAPGPVFGLPQLYIVGIGVAVACALFFMAFYAFRVAEEARQLADALTATELVLAREQHLTAIDGLAAAAAHELGTPLATIHLAATELQRELGSDPRFADDLALLKSQSERCREILAKLASLSGEADWHHARNPLSALLAEVVEPHTAFDIDVSVTMLAGPGEEPVALRNPAILYGLGNLVENAVDFASSRVDVSARWNETTVTVTVMDDGPGFADSIIDRIGEPYVTTRGSRLEERGEGNGGFGLGFFIAKTLLERTGARIELANRSPPQSGAIVRIHWPKAALAANSGESGAGQGDAGTGASWIAPWQRLFGRNDGRGRYEKLAG